MKLEKRKGKIIKCSFCEKELYAYPSRLETWQRKFCSKRCYGLAQRTNKERKCIICGNKYYVSKSQVFYRNISCCSNECRYRKQAGVMKEKYKIHKELCKKEGLAPRHFYTRNMKKGKEKTTRSLIKKLDKIYSIYIRSKYLVNGETACITCGRSLTMDKLDNGHYISRRHMNTRFEEKNTWPQCRKCNRFENGRMPEYAIFLTNKYGHDILKELQKQGDTIKQWTPIELEELIELYQDKINQLKTP
jgi:hypothetical protein